MNSPQGSLCPLLCSILLLLGCTCQVAKGQADPLAATSLGNDFLVSFLPNFFDSRHPTPTVELHITTPNTNASATPVTVEYPVGTVFTNVTIFAGQVQVVSLPTLASTKWIEEYRFRDTLYNSIRVCSDVPTAAFTVYMVNRQSFTSDAALALPINALNNKYIVTDYAVDTRNVNFAQAFVVTAVNNDTQVVITPTQNLRTVELPQAGVPFVVTLDRGESFFAMGRSESIGLSGTLIESDLPVAVTSGNRCADVPTGVAQCDHLFEMNQPVQSWGTKVVAANLPQRLGGSIYRVYAATVNTTISISNSTNTFTISLSEQEFYETEPIADSIFVDSDKPIFLVQFMTGVASPGATAGDPSMGNIIPTNQFLTQYTFSTVDSDQFATHYLSIVAFAADVGTLTLDGVAIPSTNYTIVADGPWFTAVIPLTEGTHTTVSTSALGHGITIEGYNVDDSYLYPGGANFGILQQVRDIIPPRCIAEHDVAANSVIASVIDMVDEDANGNNVLDMGEDSNSNDLLDVDSGILAVYVDMASTNLQVETIDFVPGDRVVNFTVTQRDESFDGRGTVLAMDGGGNFCTLNVAILVPSDAPSFVPSSMPSTGPTSMPSTGPTSMPSTGPTSMPSMEPSSIPSIVPSSGPSFAASAVPSTGPSVAPSDMPLVELSMVPSTMPSTGPSMVPSTDPSATPSVVPSVIPSTTPSTTPSMDPTKLPSMVPSLASSTPSIPIGDRSSPSVVTVGPTPNPTSGPTPVPTPYPTGKGGKGGKGGKTVKRGKGGKGGKGSRKGHVYDHMHLHNYRHLRKRRQ